ncbi:cytidyltransferase domain protein [Necator americanus]|uniref:ethanolamine-phosphate cytidylyltransferase n=1 Tax=Necator americanus TaxID=51031 RepID=W2SZV7_NECAM|nr:cytidyltransferase domain protein [Necator americanus]ETN75188.1 cytidyltransferase domain protein [Necator americanus]
MTEQWCENIWVDGSFDVVHFGHIHKLRQARKYGQSLIVGVHSDEEVSIIDLFLTFDLRPVLHRDQHLLQILRNIGKHPVFNENERYRLVSGLKFVDKVVEDAPYHTTTSILDENQCNFCVIDENIANNERTEEVRRAGRCVIAKQAFKISSQDIIERVIRMHAAIHNGEDH